MTRSTNLKTAQLQNIGDSPVFGEIIPSEVYCVHSGEGVPCGVQLLGIYQTYEAAVQAARGLILNKEELNGDTYTTRSEEIKGNVIGFWQVEDEEGDYDIVMITKEKVQISGYIQGA